MHGTLVDLLVQGLTSEEPDEEIVDDGKQIVTLDDLFIRTKDQKLVHFVPNEIQRLVLDEHWPNWREHDYSMKGLNLLYLKARQFGFSTLFLALFFCDTINNPNTETIIVAHDKDATLSLFERVRLFYDYLPPSKKAATRYSNRHELQFKDIHSRIFIATAGSKEVGRAKTINNALLSEYALYSDPETLMTGLLNTMPKGANAIIESTANGVGNDFQLEWDNTQNNSSSFTGRFYPWFTHSEYQLDEPYEGELDEHEEMLVDEYGVTRHQLAWRRHEMRKPGNRKKFPQEYPATAEEAFMSSGNPYFDRGLLRAMAMVAKPGIAKPEIPSQFAKLRAVAASSSDPDAAGKLEIFAQPIPGRLYVIGADTAEGVTEKGDPDYDSAHVLDSVTLEEVAHLHGRWDTHHFGMQLAELGWLYNTALLGVERNHHGHAVLNTLIHMAKYPHMRLDDPHGLYFHESIDENKPVKVRKAGWPTTQHTKTFANDALASDILNGELSIRSKSTIAECIRFVHKPGGKSGGEGSSHDDRVISLGIACAMLRVRPRVKRRGEASSSTTGTKYETR